MIKKSTAVKALVGLGAGAAGLATAVPAGASMNITFRTPYNVNSSIAGGVTLNGVPDGVITWSGVQYVNAYASSGGWRKVGATQVNLAGGQDGNFQKTGLGCDSRAGAVFETAGDLTVKYIGTTSGGGGVTILGSGGSASATWNSVKTASIHIQSDPNVHLGCS